MKVIGNGTMYRIFGDDMETYESIPKGTYRVNFNPMAGYSLERLSDLKTKEDAVYGTHHDKLKKVISTYKRMQDEGGRSLGVLMSGDKGIGKTMFTQMLSEEVDKMDIPVIIVDRMSDDLPSFLMSIEQRVMILFDEFEKLFDNESQERMLSMFDGLHSSPHLYVITVNEMSRVNDYLLNRPGRIHYHIRFHYPTYDEVYQYIKDKLEGTGMTDAKVKGLAREVGLLSYRVNLNFDMLRAIAFELQSTPDLREAIEDLNIEGVGSTKVNININFKNPNIPTIFMNDEMDFSAEKGNVDVYAYNHIVHNIDIDIPMEELIINEDTGKLVYVIEDSSDIERAYIRMSGTYVTNVVKALQALKFSQDDALPGTLDLFVRDFEEELMKGIEDLNNIPLHILENNLEKIIRENISTVEFTIVKESYKKLTF